MGLGGKFVYVVYDRHLLRIDVAGLSQNTWNPEDKMEKVDCWKKHDPVAMGSLIHGSRLYFVGGEKIPFVDRSYCLGMFDDIIRPPPPPPPPLPPAFESTRYSGGCLVLFDVIAGGLNQNNSPKFNHPRVICDSKVNDFYNDKNTPKRMREFRNSHGVKDFLNKHLLMLNPLTPGHLHPSTFPPMKTGKPHPSVFKIDDKIYVLGGDQLDPCAEIPSPQFECYDPNSGNWEQLDDPPYIQRTLYNGIPYNRLAYFNDYTLGRRRYMRLLEFSTRNYYFFNVDDRKWYKDFKIEERYEEAKVPFPFDCQKGCLLERKLEQGGEQVLVIAYTKREGLVAYIYDPSSSYGWDLPVHHHVLDSSDLGLHLLQPPPSSSSPEGECFYNINNPFPPTAFIHELGEDDKVILFSTDYEVAQFAILRITRLQLNQQSFLSVQTLYRHVFCYNHAFRSLVKTDHSSINNVLVCEHPKRPAPHSHLPKGPAPHSHPPKGPAPHCHPPKGPAPHCHLATGRRKVKISQPRCHLATKRHATPKGGRKEIAKLAET